MSEFDRRQLFVMLDSLENFDTEFGSLENLTGQMLSLRDLMESSDQHWYYEFTQELVTLDSASQTTIEQRLGMGLQFDKIIRDALQSLRNLVATALSRNAPDSTGDKA